jgi:hypothetical protein
MAERSIANRLLRMFVGALVGLGICGIAAASGFIEWVKDMPAEDIASTVLAMFFLVLAVFAAIVSTSQGAYKLIADNYREGDPVGDDVLRLMRMSAVLLVLSGVLLLAPPIAVRLGLGDTATIAVAAAIGLLLLVATWLSWRATRMSDELNRTLAVESSAVSFWVLTIGLFGWASLVKLGLAPEIGAWTLMMITMAVSLLVQIAMAVRRGLFA